MRVATHDRLALLVAGCTLSAGTLQAVATVLAIRLRLVVWTVRRITGTFFLGITGARARTANGLCGGELAVLAAVLIGIVADGIVDEFAGLWIAAAVASTACRAAAVALFVTFDDAVAAGLPGYGGNTTIVGETR